MTSNVIIAGSRMISDYSLLLKAISEAIEEEFCEQEFQVVSGGAKGVDY